MTVMGEHLREATVAGGLVSAAEFDTCAALLDNPATVLMGASMIVAWGRRPGA